MRLDEAKQTLANPIPELGGYDIEQALEWTLDALARIATLVKPLPVKTLVDNEAVTELLKRQKQIRAILKEAENGNH